MDVPGCGAKVLCDAEELKHYSKGQIVRNLKVFSHVAHLNPLSSHLSVDPLLQFECYGHIDKDNELTILCHHF